MSSPSNPSPQTNLKGMSTIDNIIDLSNLLDDRLSKVEQSITSSSNNTTSTKDDLHIKSKTEKEESTGDNIHNQFEKIVRDLKQIKESFRNLRKLEEVAVRAIEKLESSLVDISNVVEQTPNDLSIVDKVKAKLSALKNDARKLKFNFPLQWPHKMSYTSSDFHPDSRSRNGSNSEVDELPGLQVSNNFLTTLVCTEFQNVFKDLDTRLKLCCLSFVVLPANVVVKRRLLINWWVGEGLVYPPTTGNKTADDLADEILTELEVKGFIEPVKERHKLVADGFKMQHLVHHVVIMLAKEAQLIDYDYDFNGNPRVKSSGCNRACLWKAEDGTLEQDLDLEKLHTIFNINEPFPGVRIEWYAKTKNVNVVEWFSRMKNLKVLYLGRWQSSYQDFIQEERSDQHHIVTQGSLKNHIEVESTEVLKGFKNMKCLRLLSLQGISRINELPNSIGKLTNLKILDLKACHNLESLPEEIALLKKLSYLDISGCYLLDGMPKGIASLLELQVLKGFLVDNLESTKSCTLEDLFGLKKLSKLSINTNSKDLPVEALRKLGALRKLAIAWGKKQENDVLNSGGTVNSDNGRQDSGAEKPTRVPSRLTMKQPHFETPGLPNLEKLELLSFPGRVTPNWLMPGKLKSLKKLYIRGGKLINLGQMEGNDLWNVEILRLKYLANFSMDWNNELLTSFPKLIFLVSVDCPKLISYPCDKCGVWQKH